MLATHSAFKTASEQVIELDTNQKCELNPMYPSATIEVECIKQTHWTQSDANSLQCAKYHSNIKWRHQHLIGNIKISEQK